MHIYIYIYIYIYTECGSKIRNHHHYRHVVPLARISLTLSRHFSLSFIASDRSSELHPVSSHSCWMYVRAGRPAFARPYVGVHRSTSLMSSSLLLQQCPVCLVRLTWIVSWWEVGGCIAAALWDFAYIYIYIYACNDIITYVIIIYTLGFSHQFYMAVVNNAVVWMVSTHPPTSKSSSPWIIFVMVGRWPYSWCLVGCFRQDLVNIARNILV